MNPAMNSVVVHLLLTCGVFMMLERGNLAASNLPPIRTVCCVGTSITDSGTAGVTGADDAGARVNYNGASYVGWLPHLLNHRITLSPRANAWQVDRDHGYSGMTLYGLVRGANESETWIPQGLIPVADACATNADVFVLEGGTNDLGLSAATVISRINAYWTYFRSRGKEVIALNLPPVGVGGGAVIRERVQAINAALPALADSLGVKLIDIHSLANFDTNGFPTTGSVWDGLHPSTSYAHKIAKAIAAEIAPRTLENPEPLIPIAGSARWITSNPFPSQGTQPQGWALVGGASTWSAQTDADGTAWQRIRMTNTGYENCWLYGGATQGFAAGDTVRLCARLRQVAADLDCQSIRIACVFYGASVVITDAIQTGSAGTGVLDPVSGLFMSDEILVPAGTTEVRWEIFQQANRATIDLRQVGIFKVKTAAQVTIGGMGAVYDGTPKAVSVVTVPMGLAVTLTYNESLSQPTEVGSYRVKAVIHDGSYSGTATGTLVIGKRTQSIDFAPLLDYPLDGGALLLKAHASSGLPVEFELVSGLATVVGATLVTRAVGVVTVRARQVGDGEWLAAEPVERAIGISGASHAYEIWARAAFGAGYDMAGGPTQDPDGDGQPNRSEWIAGTNPLDLTDRLYVSAMGFTPQKGFVLRWPTRSGIEYNVMCSADLASWGELPGARRFGDGQVVEVIDPTPPPSGRCYRVTARGPQSIEFAPLAAHPVDGGVVALEASVRSGLAVNFEWVSGPGSIVGNVLVPSGVGVVTIRARQEGNGTWQAAEPVERSIAITAATAYESWARGVFGSGYEAKGGPDQDADRDGQSNRAEWSAATSPLDPNDRLQLSGMEFSASGGFVLHWPTRAGISYKVTYSDDFHSWHDLFGSRRSGDGQMAEVIDTNPPAGSRLYRVEVVLF